MGLARGKYKEPKQPIVKAKTVEVINKLGKGISKVARLGPLDFIGVFCFMTTAVGELIGRNYGMVWYSLLFILLILLFIKETNLFKKEENGKSKRKNLQQGDGNCRDNSNTSGATE